jgi:hypothetical protein
MCTWATCFQWNDLSWYHRVSLLGVPRASFSDICFVSTLRVKLIRFDSGAVIGYRRAMFPRMDYVSIFVIRAFPDTFMWIILIIILGSVILGHYSHSDPCFCCAISKWSAYHSLIHWYHTGSNRQIT